MVNKKNHVSISVIVPVYNVEKYVEECLLSILRQLSPWDELIVINDGSTDNSYHICLNIARKYSNILLIDQKNKGLGAARNVGIKKAKGYYVCFVDSDDYISDDALDEIRKQLLRNDLDILQFDASVLEQRSNTKITKNLYDRSAMAIYSIMPGYMMFISSYPRYYQPSACLMVIRREYILEKSIFFKEDILHEDCPFTFQLLLEANTVKHIAKPLYIRRYRENSITSSSWSEKRKKGISYSAGFVYKYILSHKNKICMDLQEKILCLYLEYAEIALSIIDKDEFKAILYLWRERIKYTSSFYFALKTLHLKSLLLKYNDFGDIGKYFLKSSFENVDRVICQKKLEKLKKIPFQNPNIRIGIYGQGIHTDKLLCDYKQYIGEILSNYVFLNTYTKEEKSKYMNTAVYSIRRAAEVSDVILISSFEYQDEMIQYIDDNLGKEFPRISLYDSKDECSVFS